MYMVVLEQAQERVCCDNSLLHPMVEMCDETKRRHIELASTCEKQLSISQYPVGRMHRYSSSNEMVWDNFYSPFDLLL